ncbi:anti-FecI sigma factor, FecR [Sphingobium chlorophenolicum L-1]|uniref:Anti-FecI sigma factor, FecR n=1 Tax=Sphingobium chlorophenolicum L-1 TaxID=690566 RepID=F6F0N3_SPHCR|nr:FecR family protein [Sphingobium chlorophenolicum]AEG50355.1 anti-FecI sigma factor, FecR [Sphingobium chlorophenolicum L-1]
MDDEDIATGRRRAEAAHWFARLKTLPVSEGTLKEFFAWRREKQNADAFEEAERFWTEAGKAGNSPSILRAVTEAAARGRSRRRFRPALLIPAMAVLAAAVTAGIHYMSLAGSTFQTEPGAQRTVALDDGSRLRLNTDTSLRVRYGASQRELVLERGEALFNVAHDAARPFIVAAGDATVTALGTQFDVAHWGGRISVTLVEGRITIVAPDGSAFQLRPGEQWRWPPENRRVQPVSVGNAVAWTQGRIVFDNRTLGDAIAEVNRYGGKPIILDAPAMAGKRISGTFEAGDKQSFIKAVTAFLPLRQAAGGSADIRLVANDEQQEKISVP